MNDTRVKRPAFEPLKKKRYSDQVAELIQERIFAHQLATGAALPSEQDMSAEFQVSRSVVREALRILEISGLVTVKKGPNGGIFVAGGLHKPFRRSIRNMVASGEVRIDHLFNTRLLLEPQIAREAALNAGDSDLDALKALIQDSARHLEDAFRLKQNNLNFHLLLAKASGNPIFIVLMETVLEILVESSLDFMDPALEAHFFKNHERILRAIAKRRPQQSEKLMREDILDVMDKLAAHQKARKSRVR
jgi:GntR family transcriptional repressor for pyruvate dehydrogenase complex